MHFKCSKRDEKYLNNKQQHIRSVTLSKTSSILASISAFSIQPVAFKTKSRLSLTLRSESNLKSLKTT